MPERGIHLHDIREQLLAGSVHLHRTVRVPLGDALLPVPGLPSRHLARPVRRVRVHTDHVEAPEQLVHRGIDLKSRHLALPFLRVPDAGPTVRPVSGCELEAIQSLGPYSGPVVDIRAVEAQHNPCAVRDVFSNRAGVPTVLDKPRAHARRDPVAVEALRLCRLLLHQLEGLALDGVEIDM
jgi:hypothetical protein